MGQGEFDISNAAETSAAVDDHWTRDRPPKMTTDVTCPDVPMSRCHLSNWEKKVINDKQSPD